MNRLGRDKWVSYVIPVGITCLLFCFTSIGQSTKHCPANSDPVYPREKVLEDLAGILNRSIPEYREFYPSFSVQTERARGFFVQDLTEITNTDAPGSASCINFIDGHVYYFSPIVYDYSFGYILFLKSGVSKAFESIDCKDRGQTLQQVLLFATENHNLGEDKSLLERIKNHRRYGRFVRTDNYSSLQCKPAEDM